MHHILSESARRMWKDRLMAIIDQLIYGVRFRDTFTSAQFEYSAFVDHGSTFPDHFIYPPISGAQASVAASST